MRYLDAINATVADYLNSLGIDNKLLQTTSGTGSYFLADHLGTTRSLADSTGTITSNLQYDSFGRPVNGFAPTRYTYTGREIDSDMDLTYYRARWYEPTQGRFASEDPIGFSGGDVNLYRYVGSSPVRFGDPLGLQKGLTLKLNLERLRQCEGSLKRFKRWETVQAELRSTFVVGTSI